MRDPIDISSSYRFEQHERQDSNFDLWSVVYFRARREAGKGWMLLVKPDSSTDDLADIWDDWRSLYSDERLAKCTASGIVGGVPEYNGRLFAYIPSENITENAPHNTLNEIFGILQSIAAISERGISCTRLEDWMFVPTGAGNNPLRRLMPTPFLHRTIDSRESFRIAGYYIQERYPGLPLPLSGLIQRLANDDNPPDVGLMREPEIWSELCMLELERMSIQTTGRKNHHVLTWLSPSGKDVLLRRLAGNQLQRFREGLIYFENELASAGEDVPVENNTAKVSLDGTPAIHIVPFLRSKHLFQCLPLITLSGTSEVGIKDVYWARSVRTSPVLILELDWQMAPEVREVCVIIRNDRTAGSAEDRINALFHKFCVKPTTISPVNCRVDFSDTLHISVFSRRECKEGNGHIFSVGQHRLFESQG